jgi:hypothetical protein
MGYIYISYSRKNAEFAQRLVSDLETRGYTTWVDTDDLQAGDQWANQIEAAIQGAEVFLTLISSATVNNRTVEREISLAQQARKPIIPVLVETVPILPSLLNRQVVDATSEWDTFIDRLVNAIDASTASLNIRQSKAASAPPVSAPAAMPGQLAPKRAGGRRWIVIVGLIVFALVVASGLFLSMFSRAGSGAAAIQPSRLPATVRPSSQPPTSPPMLTVTATQVAIASTFEDSSEAPLPTYTPPPTSTRDTAAEIAMVVERTMVSFRATESSQLSPAEAAQIVALTGNSNNGWIYMSGIMAALALGVSIAALVILRSNLNRQPARFTGHRSAHHAASAPHPETVLPEQILEDYQIFISSSEKDKDWVRMVVDDLNSLGYLLWWYAKDAPGLPFGNEIRSAIYHTKVFLIVVSPDSMRSKHVEEEIRWAEIYDRPIIPVVCRSTTIEERLYGLAKGADISFIDDYKEALEFLAQAIDHHLQQRIEKMMTDSPV